MNIAGLSPATSYSTKSCSYCDAFPAMMDCISLKWEPRQILASYCVSFHSVVIRKVTNTNIPCHNVTPVPAFLLNWLEACRTLVLPCLRCGWDMAAALSSMLSCLRYQNALPYCQMCNAALISAREPLSSRKSVSVWWQPSQRQTALFWHPNWNSFPTRVQKMFTIPLLEETSKSLAPIHLWFWKWDPGSSFLRDVSQLKDWAIW